MAHSKNRPTDDEIAQRIGEILEAIKTPEHADDIIEIRKIVRKNVPFFFRSYFAAYLLKDALLGGSGRGQRDRDRKEPKRDRENGQLRDREGAQARERKGAAQQEAKRSREEPRRESREIRESREERRPEEKKERMAPLPEGVEAATLFVSAGRKRHFYPRHLLELFAGAGIPRESIGEIRLFDNYTFVQILASDAPEAVEKLDGAPFKGRKLTVSFARKKEDSPEDRRPTALSEPEFANEAEAEELPDEAEELPDEAEELLPEEEDQGIDFDSDADGEGLGSGEDEDLGDADSSFEDVLYDPDAEPSDEGLDDESDEYSNEDSEGGLEELGPVDDEDETK